VPRASTKFAKRASSFFLKSLQKFLRREADIVADPIRREGRGNWRKSISSGAASPLKPKEAIQRLLMFVKKFPTNTEMLKAFRVDRRVCCFSGFGSRSAKRRRVYAVAALSKWLR
jgi:hypothetical protein